MSQQVLDKTTQVCYNGGMDPKYCLCNCGETTKGGDFLPGHDARYKSALITSALMGNAEAEMILEVRGWTKFLDKKRAAKTKTAAVKDSAEVSGDGLPLNATRPGDLDEELFVREICSGRVVVIRRQIKGGLLFEEQLRFRNPYERSERVEGGNTYRKVAIRPSKPVLTDGVLRLHEVETGGCRNIRLIDVAGVLNR